MKYLKKNILKILLYICTVMWLILVFIFSNTKGSESSGLSLKIANKIFNLIENFSISLDTLHLIIRKTAHYGLYAFGGVLITCIILINDLKTKETLLLPNFVGFLIAILDEIHQYFIPGRICSVIDVYIDALGIFTGVVLVNIIFEILKKYKVSNIRGN